MTRRPITEKRIEDSILSSESPVLFYRDKKDYYLEQCAYLQYLQTIISILDTCYNDNTALIDKEKYKSYGKQLFREHYIKAINAPKLRIVKKIQYTLIWIAPMIYFKMKNMIRKM
ncbi:MAG: hypothetical protein ACI4F4_03145 [Lachnospiraceae bacterium]